MMLRALLLVCLLLVAPALRAAEPAGRDLLAGGAFGLSFPHPGDAALSKVPAAALPSGDALHIVVKTPASPDYDLQLSQPVPLAVADGAVLRMHFWGRSPSRSPIRAVFEEASAPYDKALAQGFVLAPEWTAMFSQPQVTSFVQLDWPPRPAALAYERLVFHDWWTDTAGKTDKTGAYKTRAFLGDYQVTVTRGGRSETMPATVTKNGSGILVLEVTAPD